MEKGSKLQPSLLETGTEGVCTGSTWSSPKGMKGMADQNRPVGESPSERAYFAKVEMGRFDSRESSDGTKLPRTELHGRSDATFSGTWAAHASQLFKLRTLVTGCERVVERWTFLLGKALFTLYYQT